MGYLKGLINFDSIVWALRKGQAVSSFRKKKTCINACVEKSRESPYLADACSKILAILLQMAKEVQSPEDVSKFIKFCEASIRTQAASFMQESPSSSSSSSSILEQRSSLLQEKANFARFVAFLYRDRVLTREVIQLVLETWMRPLLSDGDGTDCPLDLLVMMISCLSFSGELLLSDGNSDISFLVLALEVIGACAQEGGVLRAPWQEAAELLLERYAEEWEPRFLGPLPAPQKGVQSDALPRPAPSAVGRASLAAPPPPSAVGRASVAAPPPPSAVGRASVAAPTLPSAVGRASVAAPPPPSAVGRASVAAFPAPDSSFPNSLSRVEMGNHPSRPVPLCDFLASVGLEHFHGILTANGLNSVDSVQSLDPEMLHLLGISDPVDIQLLKGRPSL